MREIRVTTDVFARIWALRQTGEETETEILDRILRSIGDGNHSDSKSGGRAATPTLDPPNKGKGKIKWRDDVVNALEDLGAEGDLAEIYRAVTSQRSIAGRSLPVSTEAIIRRELENNCSESEAFTKKRDLFRPVNGIGGGRWALR